jgi:hypothetical protein
MTEKRRRLMGKWADRCNNKPAVGGDVVPLRKGVPVGVA